MADTYTQITIQLIFAVKNRNALLNDSFREELHKYIGGIIRNQNQKLLTINSVPDHIHILIGQSPTIALADLMREIKSESSRFINENKLSKYKFNWQEGYGAFSYSRSQRDRVIKYIANQQNHHQKTTFRKEYLGFLEKFEVDYDPRYLFEYFD